MKEQYIFTVTASGDRTNIMSSFPLWDKQMFLDNVKEGKNYGRYRYGKVGGYVSLLKDMLLEEFNEVFSPTEFTKKEITEIFRKEISMEYGIHGEKAKIKPLSKKDLERGCTYEDFSGSKWLYFGEVEKTTEPQYLSNYDKKEPIVEVGYGFLSSYAGVKADINVLKSPKKLLKKVETPKKEIPATLKHETGRMNWSSAEKRITLKLL